MQFKVDKEGYAALSAEMQKLYKADGEGFILAVEGMPEAEDVSGLKAKVEELLGEKKTAKEAADAAALAATTAQEAEALAKATKAGDIEAVTKSWEAKYGALQETVTSLNGTIASITSGAAATKLASELAIKGSSDVLLPHLTGRLKTEMVDGQPKTVVVDSAGKPSALSIEDLKTEFQNNAAFASVIVGSKAGGGGTNNDGPGAGGEGRVIPRSQFDEMNAGDRSAFLKDGGTLTDAD